MTDCTISTRCLWTRGPLRNKSDVVRELLLTEWEGRVELAYLLSPSPGLFFKRTRQKPDKHTPLLLHFPPPYHPIEVMMANRGWGGTWTGTPDYELLDTINGYRTHPWKDGIRTASKVLGRSELETAKLFAIFTPVLTNHKEPENTELEGERRREWFALGFNPQLAEEARLKVESFGLYVPTYQPDFWTLR